MGNRWRDGNGDVRPRGNGSANGIWIGIGSEYVNASIRPQEQEQEQQEEQKEDWEGWGSQKRWG